MEKIKVILATDDTIFQEGLAQFIEAEEDLDCVAKPTNGDSTIELVKEILPDIVIMDLDIPLTNASTDVGHSAEVARQIKEVHPSAVILMVSSHGYQQGLFASLQAGVAGCLLKKTAPRELINAIRSLHSGEAVFDLEDVTKLIGRLATNRGEQMTGVAPLRPREVEILKEAAKGTTNKEIATELGISERTVQTHLVNIFRKLDCSSRTEAVLRAFRDGWLTVDDLP